MQVRVRIDSLLTPSPERLFLTPRILRLTRTDEPSDPTPRNFSVQRLQEATDQISMSPEQRKLLKQLYRLREDEQAYEEGGKGKADVPKMHHGQD